MSHIHRQSYRYCSNSRYGCRRSVGKSYFIKIAGKCGQELPTVSNNQQTEKDDLIQYQSMFSYIVLTIHVSKLQNNSLDKYLYSR